MTVLVLSSRFPWPSFTGDRLRAAIWLSALQHRGRVVLVAPPGTVPHDAPPLHFHAARPSIACALRGAGRVVTGAPFQSLIAARYDWRDAIAAAQREHGPFDTTVVLLSRLDAAVRRDLPPGLHVLDAVDSLRRSAVERAREGSPLLRPLWAVEARRIGRVERSAVDAYDRIVVVSEEDAAELHAATISNGIDLAPLADAPRAFDFAFWGRLAYFANADAASWLLDEIWPAIRAERPDATLVIAGADAPPRIRAAHGRDGVTVLSPIPDVPAFARNVRIALFPVRFGTGQSTKVMEAAEAGCAIVGTPRAMRALEPLAALASVADDTRSLAAAAVALLRDDARRRAMAAALRDAVETHFSRGVTRRRLAAIATPAEAAA